jgi:hypothetical protein
MKNLDDALKLQSTLLSWKTRFLSNHPHLTIGYQENLDNPADTLNSVIDYIGISPTRDQINAALSLVNPDKRHITPS